MSCTTQQLSCYLPYGLKVMLNGSNHPTRILGLELNPLNIIVVRYGEIRESKVSLKYVKPILRPLSDLTEPEIMELLMSGMAEDVLEVLQKAHEFAGYTSGQVIRLYDKTQGIQLIAPAYTLVSYSISTCQFNLKWGFRYNMFDVFQKMFEMHLDVFGLIESGDAIDVNTLPKQ